MRYRAGTARRLGRNWVATINLLMIARLGCGLPLGSRNHQFLDSKRLHGILSSAS